MNNSALPYWLAAMVLIVASYGAWKWWQVENFQARQSEGGLEFSGPPLKEFELTERSGKPFRSDEMLGKVWVSTFFFATCPGPCKRLNSSIKYLHDLDELKEVVWVSITVDPDTDTLDKLQEYAQSFDADTNRWLFCRGDMDYIRRVGKDVFQLPVGWKSHNEYAVVIDKFGKVRGMYEAVRTSQVDKMRVLLLKCLEEEGPSVEDKPLKEMQEELSDETATAEAA